MLKNKFLQKIFKILWILMPKWRKSLQNLVFSSNFRSKFVLGYKTWDLEQAIHIATEEQENMMHEENQKLNKQSQ